MTDPRKPGSRLGPRPPARPQPDSHTAHLTLHHRASAELETRRGGTAQSSGVRMVLGLAGLASASALASAMLPSVLPQPTVVTTVDTSAVAAGPTAQPQPSVVHVTHVITLAPGQTLPPDAAANMAPTTPTPTPRATPGPTPRVIIQTVTRQSGRP